MHPYMDTHALIHKENSFEIFLAAGSAFQTPESRMCHQVHLAPLPTASSSSLWWKTYREALFIWHKSVLLSREVVRSYFIIYIYG